MRNIQIQLTAIFNGETCALKNMYFSEALTPEEIRAVHDSLAEELKTMGDTFADFPFECEQEAEND